MLLFRSAGVSVGPGAAQGQERAEEGPGSAICRGLLQKLNLSLTVPSLESGRALLCGTFNVDFSREQNAGKISQETAD